MSLCSESPSAAVSGGGGGGGGSGATDGCGVGGGGEFMLFGVRVKVDPMRKSASMNNLSDYEPVANTGNPSEKTGNELPKAAEEAGGIAGYASADDATPPPSSGSRERKRGVPWTEAEHKLFLVGLQKVGKGDWRGISRNYVKTRTPTQVASHAQKYFLRRTNYNRRRRRTSLFDITTDSVNATPMEKSRNHQDSPAAAQPVPPPPVTSNINGFSVVPFPMTVGPVLLSMQGGNQMEISAVGQRDQINNSSPMLLCPVPVLPMPNSSRAMDLNLNQQVPLEQSPMSLRLSLSSGQDQPLTRESAFQAISSFKNGDSMISVA